MCTLCFSVCFGCLMVEVIAVACLGWQRVMQQRTIKDVAVCMSTSMRTAVNLRALRRETAPSCLPVHLPEHMRIAAGRGRVRSFWAPCGFIPGSGVNLAFIDHWIELRWINGMHLDAWMLETLHAVRWTTGKRHGGAFNQHSVLAISAMFWFIFLCRLFSGIMLKR